MEQALGTGIGICLGGIVALVIGAVSLVVIARILRRQQLESLGDAWLDAVVTTVNSNHEE